MTKLQEAFLTELKSKEKRNIIEFASLYSKHTQLAIDYERSKGVSEHQAKAMGEYYTVSVLSDYIRSENKLARIIALKESTSSDL